MDKLPTENKSTAPSAASKPIDTINKLNKPKIPFISILNFLLSLLALVLILFIGWQVLREQTFLKELQQKVDGHINQTNVAIEQQRITSLDLKKQVKNLMGQIGAVDKSFLVEVDFLIRLAHANLLAHNSMDALALLKNADQILQSSGMPASAAVRQAIAHDMAAINSAVPVDQVELLARLNTVEQAIAQLSVQNLQKQNSFSNFEKNLTPPIPLQAMPWWQRAWSSMKEAFSHMLVVRHHQQSIEPLLSVEQQAFILQTMQLKISQAQWALINYKKNLYQTSLQQVVNRMTQYFPAEQKILQQLQSLLNINIAPNLPDLSASLQAINNELAHKSATTNALPIPAPENAPASPLKPEKAKPEVQQPEHEAFPI
jgi:uroporphyrin-3 C-methyltransferase